METFSERLDKLLKLNKMSQSEIARQVGISVNGISTWRATGGYPRADVAVKMARVLNTSTEYLIDGSFTAIDEYNKKLINRAQELNDEKKELLLLLAEKLSNLQ